MAGTSIYKLVDGKPVEVGYIKSDTEIDKDTERKIREVYSVEEEIKLNRMANAVAKTNTHEEFTTYHEFVESCVEEGKAKKLAVAAARAELVEVTIQENGEDRTIYTLPEEE